MYTDVDSIPHRAPASMLEWGVVFFLLYASFSHPLFVQYFFPSGVYKIGFVFCFLTVLSLLVLRLMSGAYGYRLGIRWNMVLLIGAWMFYLGCTTIATILHADDSAAAELFLAYVKVIAAIMIFMVLTVDLYCWTLDRYTNLVFIGAATSAVVVLLVFVGVMEPLGEVGVGGIGATTREFYGLSLGWGQLPIPGSAYSIIRLQSFADEPGTFAFMLLLGIVWAFHRGWRWHVVVMSVALFLTWSVGALLAGMVLLLAYLAKRGSIKLFVASFVVAALVLSVYQSNADLVDIVTRYLETKNGEAAERLDSVGDRVEYIDKLQKLIDKHPEGVGLGVHAVGFTSPVGWLVPLSDSGVLGFVFYCVAGGILLVLALRTALFYQGKCRVLGIMVLVLAFSALQRARIDYSVWHFWLLTGFLKIYLHHSMMRSQVVVLQDTGGALI